MKEAFGGISFCPAIELAGSNEAEMIQTTGKSAKTMQTHIKA
jgi:hypothetical protein